MPLVVLCLRGGIGRRDAVQDCHSSHGSTAVATSVDEVVADPSLVERMTGALRHRGIPYQQYFRGFMPPSVPGTLRAEKQMPWRRLTFEVKRLVGIW